MKLDTQWYLNNVGKNTKNLSWLLRIVVFFILISPIYTKDSLFYIKDFLLIDIIQYLYLTLYFEFMGWKQHLNYNTQHYWWHVIPAYLLFYFKTGIIIFGLLL